MKEILMYIIAIIFFLFISVFLNAYTNKLLSENCAKKGGIFYLASANATHSLCEIKK